MRLFTWRECNALTFQGCCVVHDIWSFDKEHKVEAGTEWDTIEYIPSQNTLYFYASADTRHVDMPFDFVTMIFPCPYSYSVHQWWYERADACMVAVLLTGETLKFYSSGCIEYWVNEVERDQGDDAIHVCDACYLGDETPAPWMSVDSVAVKWFQDLMTHRRFVT